MQKLRGLALYVEYLRYTLLVTVTVFLLSLCDCSSADWHLHRELHSTSAALDTVFLFCCFGTAVCRLMNSRLSSSLAKCEHISVQWSWRGVKRWGMTSDGDFDTRLTFLPKQENNGEKLKGQYIVLLSVSLFHRLTLSRRICESIYFITCVMYKNLYFPRFQIVLFITVK